jgi:hypothetical protein
MAFLHWVFVLASTGAMARSFEKTSPLRRTIKSKDTTKALVSIPLIPHHRQTERRSRSRRLETDDENIDPLYQGHGTHYVDLWVGCPPQRQTVIVDTGSSQTAFPCTGCQDCGAGSSHTDGLFLQQESSCFQKVTCDACFLGKCHNDDTNTRNSNSSAYCQVSSHYVEGSSWKGFESIDKVYTGGSHLAYDPEEESEKAFDFHFGCQTSLRGLFKTQLADGIMGMSMHDKSYWSQMHDAGHLPGFEFSLCFTKAPTASRQGTGAGAMIMGGTDTRLHTTPMVYAKQIVSSSEFYNLELEKMYLRTGGGESVLSISEDDVRKTVVIKPDDLNTGGVIVDSGTSTTILTEKLLHPFKTAWKSATGQDYNEDFYEITHEEMMAFPTIIFQFAPWGNDNNDGSVPGITGEAFDRWHPNSILVAFPPSHYFSYLPARGTYVSHIYFRAKKGKKQTFGANFLMGKDVHFDLEKNRIGFAESICEYSTLGLANFNTTPKVTEEEVIVNKLIDIDTNTNPDGPGIDTAEPVSDDETALEPTCSSKTCQRGLVLGFLVWIGVVAGMLLRNPQVPSRYHIAQGTQLEESMGNCELKEFGRYSDQVAATEVDVSDDEAGSVGSLQ